MPMDRPSAEPLDVLPPRPEDLYVWSDSWETAWWRSPRYLPCAGALLAALMMHASVLACMAAAGLFAGGFGEPDTPPTIETVRLGSVGDGYRAGKIGHKDGTSDKPNLRSSAPAVPTQPQASKPASTVMATKPIPPVTAPQPTQAKPVVRPTAPPPTPLPTVAATKPNPPVQPPQPTQPKPAPTQPRPEPTPPVVKDTVAAKVVPEKPLPPPVKKEEKTPDPKPASTIPTAPLSTPKVAQSTAPVGPSKPTTEEQQASAAPPPPSKARDGDAGGESSKGDSTTNGSGQRRGSRGSGGEGDGVDPPRGFYNPEPAYPAAALAAGREGTVILWLRIDADGYVEWAKIYQSSGDPEMDESALSTVRRWRFRPGTRRGLPVACEHSKEINFKIRR